MCWIFQVITDEEMMEAEDLESLRDLAEKYEWEMPKEYEEYLGNTCLCPLTLQDLGGDELTEEIWNGIGKWKFKKQDGAIIVTCKKETREMDWDELNPRSLFHKILLTELKDKNELTIVSM